jgi:hypothetical protein
MTPLTDLAKQCGATTCFPPQIAFDGEEQLAGFVERIREEEREKAEQDARRYRWLRDEENGDSELCPFVAGDTLDAAIDDAIREARDA